MDTALPKGPAKPSVRIETIMAVAGFSTENPEDWIKAILFYLDEEYERSISH